MPRQTVAIILIAPTNYEILPLRYFILSLNKIQSVYEFSLPDVQLALEKDQYTEEQLLRIVASIDEALSPKFDYSIAITTRKIEGNLFFTSRETFAVITTDTWEAYFSPPSMFEYLLHCTAASLLFMHPSLDLDSHLDTRGCVLDYTRLKADDRVDIALGYICDSDCEHIKQRVSEDYLRQMQLIISRKWIGAVNQPGSVAYDLKHFFRFDIDRDSGINKTFGERVRAKLDEVPIEAIKIIMQTLIALILAALLLFFGLKNN